MNQVFEGFTASLFLDEEGDWVAHFVELPSVSAFADSPEKAMKELEAAWKLMKESYQKKGASVSSLSSFVVGQA